MGGCALCQEVDLYLVPTGATMSDPVFFSKAMLVAFGASIILGGVIVRRSISLGSSLLLGLVTALLRAQYDPSPAVVVGFVGYPWICMWLNRLGALLRRKIFSRPEKPGSE